MRIADCSLRIKSVDLAPQVLIVFALTLAFIATTRPALAEVKVIEADSTYVMGSNDKRDEAQRIASQEAKRKVLELAATYVEGLAAVKSLPLSRGEVRTYATGALAVFIAPGQTRGAAGIAEVYSRALCTVDSEQIIVKLGRFSRNEDLKEQYETYQQDNEALKKERDALIKKLASQNDQHKITATRQKLASILTREEANDDAQSVCAVLGQQITDPEERGQALTAADLDRYAGILERTAITSPHNQRAHYLLAGIYQQKGDIAAAEARLRTAIKNHPSSTSAHVKLGLLLKERGRYQEALKEFQFVKHMQPKHSLFPFYAGMTYKDLGKCGKAVQNLNKFLKDKRTINYPAKKDQAAAAIEACGGDRPGRQRKAQHL